MIKEKIEMAVILATASAILFAGTRVVEKAHAPYFQGTEHESVSEMTKVVEETTVDSKSLKDEMLLKELKKSTAKVKKEAELDLRIDEQPEEQTETTQTATAEQVEPEIEYSRSSSWEDFDSIKEWYESLSEVDQLAHLIYGESGDQSNDCQRAVGTVVMNRIASDSFPGNTIADVVFQESQYACTWDGNILQTPSERAYENAAWVLSGGRNLDADYVFQSMREESYAWGYKWIGSECFGKG